MFGIACFKTDCFGHIFWEVQEFLPKLFKYASITIEVGMSLYIVPDYINIKCAVSIKVDVGRDNDSTSFHV